jgi:hypothetical protein
MSEGLSEQRAEKKLEKGADLPVQFSDEEISAIANEIFKPEGGIVNESVKFYTGQEKLEGYQRALLAPANAFEALISFGVNIFTGKAKEDFTMLIDSISDKKARDMMLATLEKGWENCTRAEKVAFILEFISTALIVGGTLSRLQKIIPMDKLAVLQKAATAKRLQFLAAAIAGNPADDVIAAAAPVIGKVKSIKSAGLGK